MEGSITNAEISDTAKLPISRAKRFIADWNVWKAKLEFCANEILGQLPFFASLTSQIKQITHKLPGAFCRIIFHFQALAIVKLAHLANQIPLEFGKDIIPLGRRKLI